MGMDEHRTKRLTEFVDWCGANITGDEKGEALWSGVPLSLFRRRGQVLKVEGMILTGSTTGGPTMLAGIGRLLLAFRDIARNIWHLLHIGRLIAAS